MSVGLLDFFILEASDYVERLDGLLASAGPAGPDVAAYTRLTRGLRGSATMAKLDPMAELSAAMERLGRALHEGSVTWDEAVRGTLVATVDDLKILLHRVRAWGTSEDARAQARTAELAAHLGRARPSPATPTMSTGAASAGGASFVATQADELAGAVEALLAPAGGRAELANVLRRARALRGVATLGDLPPLADVIDGVERAAKPLEFADAAASPRQRELLAAAAAVLRHAAGEVRDGGRPQASSAALERFAAAAATLDDELAEANRIVPVAELFATGPGPHVVSRAPNPPTLPADRFRLEAVSQAEHLRRLTADARSAADPVRRERVGRELRLALRALGDAAQSFGERDVAGFAAAFAPTIASLDPRALDALDEVASLLADPSAAPAERARRMAALLDVTLATPLSSPAIAPTSMAASADRPTVSRTPSPVVPAPVRHTPAAPIAVAAPVQASSAEPSSRTAVATPTGRELHALLQHGLAGIGQLDRQPLNAITAEGTDGRDDGIVPIESLLYDAKGALARARAIRDQIRTQSAGRPLPPPIAELFDLLDLVRVG